MYKKTAIALLSLLAVSLVPNRAIAWGERGHDIVTRVAVYHLARYSGGGGSLYESFLRRADMLGHISNIPDSHWRALGKNEQHVGGPTHFVRVAAMVNSFDIRDVPKNWRQAAVSAARGGDKLPNAGTAPWRVQQFGRRLEQAMGKVRDAGDVESYNEAVVDVFRNAGLLSHFLADLSQPCHTQRDSDGWETRQGGLHAYLETEIVVGLGLDLPGKIFKAALALHVGQSEKNFKRLKRRLLTRDRWDGDAAYYNLAWALALGSAAVANEVTATDRRFAVLEHSREEGGRVPAVRHPAAAVAHRFEDLVVERMASAAELLAGIWFTAWERAGKPDLSKYQAAEYIFQPGFVMPDYPAQQ